MATIVGRRADWRELDSRRTAGLDVILVWSKTHGQVKVIVEDAVTGEHFVLTPPPADARFAFEHPFAVRRLEA